MPSGVDNEHIRNRLRLHFLGRRLSLLLDDADRE